MLDGWRVQDPRSQGKSEQAREGELAQEWDPDQVGGPSGSSPKDSGKGDNPTPVATVCMELVNCDAN